MLPANQGRSRARSLRPGWHHLLPRTLLAALVWSLWRRRHQADAAPSPLEKNEMLNRSSAGGRSSPEHQSTFPIQANIGQRSARSVACAVIAPMVLLGACAPGYVGYTDSPAFTDDGTGVLRISEGWGGSFSRTWQRIRKLQQENVLFMVDGPCASACTLVLDENYPHVCWTDRAEFLFHGASQRQASSNAGGAIANMLLFAKLPPYVRDQLPPPKKWTTSTWHRVKATELPASGHCQDNPRFAALEQQDEAYLASRHGEDLATRQTSYRAVGDEEFLENVRESLARHPTLRGRILEGAIKTRPHLEERISALDSKA